MSPKLDWISSFCEAKLVSIQFIEYDIMTIVLSIVLYLILTLILYGFFLAFISLMLSLSHSLNRSVNRSLFLSGNWCKAEKKA